MRPSLAFLIRAVPAASFAAILWCLVPAPAAGAAAVTFSEIPRDLQLYARDTADSARVVFAGRVPDPGPGGIPHAQVKLVVHRYGRVWGTDTAPLVYESGSGAPFHLEVSIHAELSNYAASFLLDDSLVVSRDSLVCGDAYLIDGQSNAVAYDYDRTTTETNPWLRSFGTSDTLAAACVADSAWYLARADLQYTSGAVGVWGLFLGMHLVEDCRVPVAILNGAVGATTIDRHFRNDANPMDPHGIYGRLLLRTYNAGLQHAVRAILWHQGESDSWDEWALYPSRFDTLWNDWHMDYAPLERVYVFQIRPGCGGFDQSEIREFEREFPGRYPHLEVMSTVGLRSHDGCHYHKPGYRQMAAWIYPLLERDLYGSSDTLNVEPPDVQSAWYTSPVHDEIRVLFNEPVVWPADTLGFSMRDYFALDDAWGVVDSGYVAPDARTLILKLREPSWAGLLTYIPNCFYLPPFDSTLYEGPWIRNPRGLGALTFWHIPILDEMPAGVAENPAEAGSSFLTSIPNPALGETSIRFRIPEAGRVRIRIFDAGGREVRALLDRRLEPGAAEVRWDGRSEEGRILAPGIYYVRVQSPGAALSGKLVLLR